MVEECQFSVQFKKIRVILSLLELVGNVWLRLVAVGRDWFGRVGAVCGCLGLPGVIDSGWGLVCGQQQKERA